MAHTLICRDLYQTEILGINYGNRQLSFDGQSKVGKVVFDSGSSYTYFPKEAYLDLVASVSFYIYQSGTILTFFLSLFLNTTNSLCMCIGAA